MEVKLDIFLALLREFNLTEVPRKVDVSNCYIQAHAHTSKEKTPLSRFNCLIIKNWVGGWPGVSRATAFLPQSITFECEALIFNLVMVSGGGGVHSKISILNENSNLKKKPCLVFIQDLQTHK